jgi:predicted acylesterase/phospholipase RssA
MKVLVEFGLRGAAVLSETVDHHVQGDTMRSTGSPRPLRVLRRNVATPLLAGCLVGILLGCASVRERTPVPRELGDAARIPGIPYARFWGDGLPLDLEERLEALKAKAKELDPEALRRPRNYLAISGGGANGAFGAGLLVGWTEAGDRPAFDLVTGISTGALIAPFAYLGPKYDPQLKAVYTTISTKDIMEKRGVLTALTGDAMFSSDPLKEMIAKYIDEDLLRAIAAEHKKGRRLLVGTTNLDAARPVIWSIGEIAMSGAPHALELVRSILLASASIPAAFPPVYIEVEAGDQRYDEMHVDGGATSQVFLYPAALDWRKLAKDLGVEGQPQVYVVRNSRLAPEWKTVEPTLGPIAGRTISSLIRTQGIGDLYRIYLGTQRDGMVYNLADIPADFDEQPAEAFDPEYMRKLFDVGYQLAKEGYPWQKTPPGISPP